MTDLSRFSQVPVVMADNAALSGAAGISGHRIVGVLFPANTWVAADLTIVIDPDGLGTYYDLEYFGTFVRIEEIASGAILARIFYLPDTYSAVIRGVSAKLRSVNIASEADVNQTDGPLTFKFLLEAIPE